MRDERSTRRYRGTVHRQKARVVRDGSQRVLWRAINIRLEGACTPFAGIVDMQLDIDSLALLLSNLLVLVETLQQSQGAYRGIVVLPELRLPNNKGSLQQGPCLILASLEGVAGATRAKNCCQ